MTTYTPRVFSGMQPTGNLHLGNYLGAMINWVKMQESNECIYCVVDMHAITMWQEPKALMKATRDVTAAYIACGLIPNAQLFSTNHKCKNMLSSRGFSIAWRGLVG